MKKLLIASKTTSRSGRLPIICAGVLLLAGSMFEASRSQQAQGGPEQTENLDAIVNGVRANVVEGRVIYQRAQTELGLPGGLELRAGDLLETGPDGRAEVLLQPGYVLRLGSATACRVVATQPDRFKLQLDQGSISFELLKDDWYYRGGFFERPEDSYQQVRVVTRDHEIVISRAGIYRINVMTDGRTELVVRDGEAVINGQRVKQKRVARTGQTAIEISEFDPLVEDAFDGWCRGRARALVVANRLLRDAPWILARKNGKEATIDLPPTEVQGNSAFVLSARPAAVNFVEAGVDVRQKGRDWRELTAEVDLEAGDGLRTATRSRTELLLLPNLYLRIDGDSEVVLSQISYEAVKVKLLRGRIILDVVKFDSKEPEITVEGPSISFIVAKAGNYRLNVESDRGKIIVRKGRAVIAGRSVGGCREIDSGVESDCDDKPKDGFDIWSIQRGEGSAFDGRPREAYLSRVKRNRTRSTGFWYLHPKAGYYTFIPFFSEGFRSPYGGRYSNVFSQDRMGLFRRQRLPGG